LSDSVRQWTYQRLFLHFANSGKAHTAIARPSYIIFYVQTPGIASHASMITCNSNLWSNISIENALEKWLD